MTQVLIQHSDQTGHPLGLAQVMENAHLGAVFGPGFDLIRTTHTELSITRFTINCRGKRWLNS
jgi:hypothetical protein